MIIQNYVKQLEIVVSQIKYYTKFNQPVKIIDDTLTEVIGAWSITWWHGGGGWDAVDGGCKNSSHVQSKFCVECGKSFLNEVIQTVCEE